MTEFILVVAFFAGLFGSQPQGVSVSQIGPFATAAECQAAGARLVQKFGSSVKSADFECVERKKPTTGS